MPCPGRRNKNDGRKAGRTCDRTVADSDAAQRKMIRLYAETNDAIEASAIIDSGAEVLHMLQGGLRPEVLVLDSVLSDTTIFHCCAAYANSRLSTNRILL